MGSNQSNPANALPVYLANPPAGSGITAGATPHNIVANGNNLLKTGSGTLYGISVNTGGTTSTATVYDGLDAGGTKIGTFSTVDQGGPVLPARGLAFVVGLFVVTAGAVAADITVSFA